MAKSLRDIASESAVAGWRRLRIFHPSADFATGRIGFAVGLLGLLVTFLALSANGLFIERFIQDLPFIAGTVAAVAQQGAPHVALVGPIGQANSWPYALLILDGVFSAKDVLHANLIVSWSAAILCVALLSNLVRPWIVIAVSLIAFLVACSPRESMTLYEIGHLAPYNRWGWAILTPLVFYALAPMNVARKAQAWRAALAGTGLFLLLFLKVTYFGAACIVFGAATVLGLFQLRAAVLSMLVCTAGVAILELANGSVGLYLHDLAAALGAGDPAERMSRLRPLFIEGLFYGAVFVVVLWLSTPVASFSMQDWWRWIKAHFKAITAGAVMTGAALMVLLQNHHVFEAALLSASPFLALSFAEGHVRLERSVWRLAAWAGVALACLVGLVTPALDVATLARHSFMSRYASAGIDALVDTPWRDLRIPTPEGASDPIGLDELMAAASAQPPKGRFFRLYWEAARTAEAMEYLKDNVLADDVVFSYYHANQFPLLLGLAIPQTSMQWWDYGRTFSDEKHIAPDTLFANTTIFLEPRNFAEYVHWSDSESLENAWRLYGSYIVANFTPVAELEFWRIWRRTEPGSN